MVLVVAVSESRGIVESLFFRQLSEWTGSLQGYTKQTQYTRYEEVQERTPEEYCHCYQYD